MTTVLKTCDKCHARIAADPTEFLVEGALSGLVESVDLCGPCADAFLSWLHAPSPAFARPPASAPLASRPRMAATG